MRISDRESLFAENRSKESGSVAVPLLVLAVILGGAAISGLSYALLWRSKAALQLRLDRCAESAAEELVSIQNAIEFANLRLKAERAAAAAAAVPSFGASIESAQPVLAAEVALQEAERIQWAVRQAKWIALRGCDSRNDLLLPLPNLKWSRPPADSIGPQPLEWDGNEKRMTLRIWHANRFAGARVARSGKEIDGGWKAEWIPRAER